MSRDFNRFARPITATFEREIEDGFENQEEAFVLLDLIDAEFRSDPMSTQCFDARIVDRVRTCVAKRRASQKVSRI